MDELVMYSDREDSKVDYKSVYNSNSARNKYDDKPISNTTKTFEQLLQENLDSMKEYKKAVPVINSHEDSKLNDKIIYNKNTNHKQGSGVSKKLFYDNFDQSDDDYNSMEEFEKLEEQCMNSITKKTKLKNTLHNDTSNKNRNRK